MFIYIYIYINIAEKDDVQIGVIPEKNASMFVVAAGGEGKETARMPILGRTDSQNIPQGWKNC